MWNDNYITLIEQTNVSKIGVYDFYSRSDTSDLRVDILFLQASVSATPTALTGYHWLNATYLNVITSTNAVLAIILIVSRYTRNMLPYTISGDNQLKAGVMCYTWFV